MTSKLFTRVKMEAVFWLGRRLPTCKELTAWMSESLDQKLSLRRRIVLKLHMWICISVINSEMTNWRVYAIAGEGVARAKMIIDSGTGRIVGAVWAFGWRTHQSVRGCDAPWRDRG